MLTKEDGVLTVAKALHDEIYSKVKSESAQLVSRLVEQEVQERLPGMIAEVERGIEKKLKTHAEGYVSGLTAQTKKELEEADGRFGGGLKSLQDRSDQQIKGLGQRIGDVQNGLVSRLTEEIEGLRGELARVEELLQTKIEELLHTKIEQLHTKIEQLQNMIDEVSSAVESLREHVDSQLTELSNGQMNGMGEIHKALAASMHDLLGVVKGQSKNINLTPKFTLSPNINVPETKVIVQDKSINLTPQFNVPEVKMPEKFVLEMPERKKQKSILYDGYGRVAQIAEVEETVGAKPQEPEQSPTT